MTKNMQYPVIVAVGLGSSKKGGKPSVRAINVATGEDITSQIAYVTVQGAYKAGMWLTKESADGRWSRVAQDTTPTAAPTSTASAAPSIDQIDPTTDLTARKGVTMEFATSVDVNSFVQKRPKTLVMEDLNWKFICRTVARGGNVLLTGPTGTGKSQTAFAVGKALNREVFYINLGATQDPRGALIGNTHFSKDSGTYFNESAFVQAIQRPNTIILLDEVSRAHPEAHNILMTVLDPQQRYLRLDEAVNAPTVKVAPGVCFIGTANIGNEYTATRVMDRALLDRFIIADIPYLTPTQEGALIKNLYPSLDKSVCKNLAEIAAQTRAEVLNDGRLTTAISTRSVVEMASLLCDGFSLAECAEVAIYPLYSNDGGLQSEKTYVKQLVQKFIPDGTSNDLSGNTTTDPGRMPF